MSVRMTTTFPGKPLYQNTNHEKKIELRSKN